MLASNWADSTNISHLEYLNIVIFLIQINFFKYFFSFNTYITVPCVSVILSYCLSSLDFALPLNFIIIILVIELPYNKHFELIMPASHESIFRKISDYFKTFIQKVVLAKGVFVFAHVARLFLLINRKDGLKICKFARPTLFPFLSVGLAFPAQFSIHFCKLFCK